MLTNNPEKSCELWSSIEKTLFKLLLKKPRI